jgi:DNA-binding helix-hairpin-helix protein with protein kinase domain
MAAFAKLATGVKHPGTLAGRHRESRTTMGKSKDWSEQERRHLAQAEKHIAEAKAHIGRQREHIEQLRQRGHETDLAESMLPSCL